MKSVNLRGALFLSYAMISLAFLIVLMYLFRPFNKVLRRAWSIVAFKLLGVTIRVEGERDPHARLFILNHESQFDIVAFEIIDTTSDMCWIGKQELFHIPVYGHIMKAPRMLGIKREDKRGIISLLKEVQERLTHDRPIVIFPEGTRGHGGKLLPFKQGAKVIGDKFALIVQPVVVEGSGAILPARSFRLHPGTIRITYLPSFRADPSTEWLEASREAMQNVMDSHRPA